MRIVFAVITLVVVAVLAVLSWPQGFGLEHVMGVAQVVAFRAAAAAIALVLALLFLIGALAARRHRVFPATLAVLLLVFAVGNAAVLTSRGWQAGAGHAGTVAEAPADAITVLSWNTLGGQADAATIAALALRVGADVVTLPETTQATAAEVQALLGAAGTPFWTHTDSHGPLGGQSTSILVSSALGEYAVNDSFGDTGELPSVVASPVHGTGPTLAAVHPVAPVPAHLDDWRSDLDWVGRLCATPDLIAAGDFNATLDHLTMLGSCSDAASAAGTGAIGTWPTSVPAVLGAPIDHVVSSPGWAVVSAEVITTEDGAGSDHRPITATLARQ